ncbi:MAG: hypothetical protein QXF12_04020 [Candidatus Aenigmatarchaeota archaeon]
MNTHEGNAKKSVFETVESIMYDLILSKVKEVMQNRELDYGDIIEIPLYDSSELAKVEHLGQEAVDYFTREYKSYAAEIFEQYFYDEIYPKCEEKEKFFLYNPICPSENSIKFVIDLDEDALLDNSISVKYGDPMVANLSNGKKKYYIMKDDGFHSEKGLYWVEVDRETAKKAAKQVI